MKLVNLVLAMLGSRPPKGVLRFLTARPDLAIPLEFSNLLGSARPTCLAIGRTISAIGFVVYTSTGRGAWISSGRGCPHSPAKALGCLLPSRTSATIGRCACGQ